jgi:hypothetical protein
LDFTIVIIELWDTFLRSNVWNVFFVGLVNCLFSSICLNIYSKLTPEPCETTVETVVDNFGWNVNSNNLCRFPKPWLKPF